jgi:hypothetical protein
MIALPFFKANAEVKPPTRAQAAKKAEKAGLLMPAGIGAILVGGLYACTFNAVGEFKWWGLGAASGVGAVACVLSRAIANQPGTSESLASILAASDKMTESAASLDQSLTATNSRLDRQQESLAFHGQSVAQLKVSMMQSSEAIEKFSNGLFRMASGYQPVEQQQPAYDYPVQHQPVAYAEEIKPQSAQAATYESGDLQFDPEDEWS